MPDSTLKTFLTREPFCASHCLVLQAGGLQSKSYKMAKPCRPSRSTRRVAWHLELRLSLQESPPPAYSGACLWLITLGRPEARSVLGERMFSVNAGQERARTPSIRPFLFLLTDPVEKRLEVPS